MPLYVNGIDLTNVLVYDNGTYQAVLLGGVEQFRVKKSDQNFQTKGSVSGYV